MREISGHKDVPANGSIFYITIVASSHLTISVIKELHLAIKMCQQMAVCFNITIVVSSHSTISVIEELSTEQHSF